MNDYWINIETNHTVFLRIKPSFLKMKALIELTSFSISFL